jgi:HD-GYP domain-containing protein (c-di-GMP phosphodiesterase class II)/DNA-binding CsgD family transcriptional regulator
LPVTRGWLRLRTMTDSASSSGGVRLAELVAVLSLGADLGMGQPMEHALRQCLIALRLGESLGLEEGERANLYYVSLIAWVGCHIDAYEQAKWFGDDLALKGDFRLRDMTGMAPLAFLASHLGAGKPLLERARMGAKFLVRGHREVDDMLANHWYAADALAEHLGLDRGVRATLFQTFERWDGKGVPSGSRGEEILLASRIVNLADVLEVFHRVAGEDGAIAVARERSGTQFAPNVVEVAVTEAPVLFGELDAVTSWDAVIAAEPGLARLLSEDELDTALEAIADFIDVKSPFTLGHSRGVADLAACAAEDLQLGADARLHVRRAALVHDIGRLGVSNAVWDKAGELTVGELERVRLHPYLTDRMLASSPELAALGATAVQHHERLDGSGYPRGLRTDALTPCGRVLAAADAYQAKLEPRPHRAAYAPEEAAGWMRDEVRAGRLDGDAAEGVLRGAGHPARRRKPRPSGLTSREVEVLRLLARGLSNKEIADALVISPKTASHHIQHIYTKIGVSNRARASLFAVTHGLMGEPTKMG